MYDELRYVDNREDILTYSYSKKVLYPIKDADAPKGNRVTFGSVILLFMSNLQNLAFVIHPDSTMTSERQATILLIQVTWIMSRTLQENGDVPFYVEFYKLISCVYRYTDIKRIGIAGKGRRFFFKNRFL